MRERSLLVIRWTGLQPHRNQLETHNECDPDPCTAHLNGWTERGGGEESRFSHCPHMPIMRVRVRADKGMRYVCVCVGLHCWSAHTGAEVLGFYLKTLLYFWHTPKQARQFPTDWLPELYSRPRGGAPLHLAKIKKHSDNISREWWVSWVTSRKSAIIFREQPPL